MQFTTKKLDDFFRSILDIESFENSDPSLNGIQVDNDGSEIKKLAFAVDACMETFKQAVQAGAGLLFVHHGLFWGKPLALETTHRKRIKFLMDNNLALYAVHLPLDQHPDFGNNAVLAEKLGLTDIKPFGSLHIPKIGLQGKFPQALTVEEAASRISFMGRPSLKIIPFGKKHNESCAIVSGGSSGETVHAIEEGIDLFVTGEAAHSMYHRALEGNLNIIADGHYSTEVWGARRIMEESVTQLGIEAEFIDVPTGL